MPKPGPIVAVLAGGRGERLGGNKASVGLGGRPLISYPLGAAREAELEAIIVAKPESRLPTLPERVVLDRSAGHHPLAGVLAAFGHAQRVIAVACDMPFLPPTLLRWMAEQTAEAVVTRPGDFIQPFPALYSHRHARELEMALAAGRSLRETIELMRPQVLDNQQLDAFGLEARMFFSVNTPADLETAEAWLTQGAAAAAQPR